MGRAGHRLGTAGHWLDTAGHSWTPLDTAGHHWTPQQHTESHQQTCEGVVGSVLALKKGKLSKSAELGGGRVVLALAEGVLRAPPDVDWILEAFRGPKSTGGVPFQLLQVPSTEFQPQRPGAGSSSGLFPSWGHPTASSVQSFPLKLANIQNIKHNIYTGTVTRGILTPSAVRCRGDKRNS